MQGSQGCIALAASSVLLLFWSCSFPSYGFVDEPPTRTGGGPGSQMGAAGEANGGEANAFAGAPSEAPYAFGGRTSEEPGGASGGENGGSGGRIDGETSIERCEDFESEPTNCDCLDYHDHAYLFCRTERSWRAAAEDCEAVGTQLLALQAAEENTWVLARISELEGPLSSENFWIGGSSEGDSWVFRWPDQTAFWVGQSDGMPTEGGYADWRNTNPKQGGCVSTNSEGWEDGNCEDLRPYLCEAY
jgi:hypothetical protein